MLEYVPARFKVIRHVRPKLACAKLRDDRAVAGAEPTDRARTRRPRTARARAGLASTPITCRSTGRAPSMRAKASISTARRSPTGWAGQRAARPAGRGDRAPRAWRPRSSTPTTRRCRCCSPGRGTTKTGRLWTYVRDDRPAGEHRAAGGRGSATRPDRKGEQPREHLDAFRGVLQADAYAGFERLYGERIQEAACWAHVRRKFYDAARGARLADRAKRTRDASASSTRSRPRSAAGRPRNARAQRQARAGPLLAALHAWLHASLASLSKKSELARCASATRSRAGRALTRYRDDGRLEIDNNAAERALRGCRARPQELAVRRRRLAAASAPPRSTRCSAPRS